MKKYRLITLVLALIVLAALQQTGSMAAPRVEALVPRAGTTYVDGLLTVNCTAGNYSIVSRDCSGSEGYNAYATIEEGANTRLPGDVVQVREGIYHEQVDIQVNGTVGNRITVQNYP
ncbi:MAG TPA: hypothetical protein VLG46_12465, partial [Anaerolineae bacterium]|nr:hypothetical protein [Anaerolineae bacterium]